VTSPGPITTAQIRAAIAIVTAARISQQGADDDALAQAVEAELPDLFANGHRAAVGAFLAIIRVLLPIAANGNDPDTIGAVWRFAVDVVGRADFPEPEGQHT
jgi:hypothetical protein